MNLRAEPNINALWARVIVEELVRSGVGLFVVSPGSRSGPLAVAVARNPRARHRVHFDERGAGFYALGYAAASGRPAAVIVTSGTAAANLLPAVIEASRKKLPLVLLTADRPPELRRTGAHQTIDQPGIFGRYVRFDFDLPPPSLELPIAMALTTVDQALHLARGRPGGPVHLNCMFREPLAPDRTGAVPAASLRPLAGWEEDGKPYTEYVSCRPRLSDEAAGRLAGLCASWRRGVVVVGKLAGGEEERAVMRLARRLQWPVCPDVSSGLRLGPTGGPLVPFHDLLLGSGAFRRRILEDGGIDGILHLGGRITSKRWASFVDEARPRGYLMVIDHPLRNDPRHGVRVRVDCGPFEFARRVTRRIPPRRPGEWLRRWVAADRAAAACLEDWEREERMDEPSLARRLSRLLPRGSGLFLGNSLAIREMDTFAAAGARPVVGGNRGASGIDGTIASAAGFARGLDRPVTALLGDLSFLHDVDSLALLQGLAVPCILVVLNNGGGGIFSFLPIARHRECEAFFTAPVAADLRAAAAVFDLPWERPTSPEAFSAAYRRALRRCGPSVIEVKVDREETVRRHAEIRRRIDRRLRKGEGS